MFVGIASRTSLREGRPSAARRRNGIALAGGLLALVLAGTTAARAAELPGASRGNAYAAFANVKAGLLAASLAKSAYQPCPCRGTNGHTLTTQVESLAVPGLLNTGVTRSSVFTEKTATTAQVRNTSRVEKLNLLGGLIRADAIESSARIDATATAMTPSSVGTTFTNLVVAGRKVAADVAPDTVIALAGIGSVTLNHVLRKGTFENAGTLVVEALTIQVTKANAFGLKTGARIVLAHAQAGYTRHEPDVVFDGHAYAATANAAIGDVLDDEIGEGASLRIGCEGTGHKTRTNSIAGLNVPGVIAMGDGSSTSFGGTEGGAQVARTTSNLTSIGLLGGLITVDGLQAVAQSTDNGGIVTGSAGGSGFAGLTVAGLSIPITLPPNTKLNLPLIGSVVVNEQHVKNDGSVSVNGLHVTVSTANLLGLPVGTEIVVAHADAAVAPF